MHTIMHRVRWYIGLLLLLCIGFNYLFVLQPTWRELEGSLVGHFAQLSQVTIGSADAALQRYLQGASGLSSRTTIRMRLMDYRRGLISWGDLVSSTAPLYADGLQALQQANGAMRVTDGQIVVEIGDVEPLRAASAEQRGLSYQVEQREDGAIAIVYSPIKEGQLTLGVDVVFFDLGAALTELTDPSLGISLAADSAAERVVEAARWKLQTPAGELFSDGQVISYLQPIGTTGYSYLVTTPADAMLEPLRRVQEASVVALIVGLGAIAIFAHWATDRGNRELLSKLERSRDHFRNRANHDALTGAYTRRFFELWVAGDGDVCVPATIVMLDIDNFKQINDTYGHQIGDQALKAVAAALMLSVRDSDLVIRYGGDEFLLLLCHCDQPAARQIVERAAGQLAGCTLFDFRLTLSYGTAGLSEPSELAAVVGQADQQMYEMKELHRAGRDVSER